MTTPDPSRAAFYAWLRTHEDEVGALDDPSALAGWQAAMAHMQAEGGGDQIDPQSLQTRMDAQSKVVPNNGWQPIETAPSYTTILVLGTSGMVVAYKDSYGDWKADGVDVTYDMAYTVLQIGKLTHWAPLPAAPNQEGCT